MLSALALATAIERGDITAAAVLDEVAAAIAAREGTVQAFTVLALEAARAALPAAQGKPLAGLPVAVKDIVDTSDLPTAYGSPAYAGHRPVADAALVRLIMRAGGVIAGKTVTTEFAYFTPGPTANPRVPGHTPGGSSQGSAAAVAAGFVPLAIGTQTAGSVIRPAAYCGVAGYKPSYRLVPMVGIKPFAWSLDTAGFFAASVADVAFGAGAVLGRDLRIDRGTPAAPRLALVRTHLWAEAEPAMQAAVEGAANRAEAAGARLTDLELPPLFADATAAQEVVMGYEAARALAFERDRHAEMLSPRLLAYLDEAERITADAYDAARRTAKRARNLYAELAAEIDGFITPAAPGAAPAGLGATGSPMFNRLWTLIGAPAVAVAGCVDAENRPLGVQLIGRFGRDRRALEAAAFLETALADG